MANNLSPQGYGYGIDPKSAHPFWMQGEKYVKDINFSENGNIVTVTITDGDGTETTQTITIPETDNLIAEIADTVTEHSSEGYDRHDLKETENNGTVNDVGHFIIARKQITNVFCNNYSVNGLPKIGLTYTNQDNETSTEEIESSYSVSDPYSITLPDVINNISINVTIGNSIFHILICLGGISKTTFGNNTYGYVTCDYKNRFYLLYTIITNNTVRVLCFVRQPVTITSVNFNI